MKPKITARSLRRWWPLVLALFGLALVACTGVRSTAATPTVQVALTQTATHIPTRYVTATPTPRPPTAEATAIATVETTHSSSPVQTETPIPSPPTIAWSVSASEIKTAYSDILDVAWVDNAQAKIIVDYYNSLVIDAASGQELTPTPYPTIAPGRSDYERYLFSPDGAYVFECSGEGLRLLRASNKEIVGQSSIPVYACYVGDWASDSSKAVFTSDDGEVYVWSVTDSSAPSRLEYNHLIWSARWSPNGQRLLLVTFSAQGDADRATVYIVDSNVDTPLNSGFEVDGGNQWVPENVDWVTDGIIINRRQGLAWYHYAYYNADSKQLITSAYLDDYTTQGEWPSPDKRWLVLDQSRPDSDARFAYSLLDFQTRTFDWLSDGGQTHLNFLGWTDDSTAFYAVSRPVTETARANVKVPFGLLALDPRSREFTSLFEQAVFAKLGPDKKLAWVVFPAKHADGALGLDGGIFNLADGTLAGRQFVSDRVLYGNPAEGDLVPAAWSNDGTRVVFGDSQGSLTLVKTDGTMQSLAANLPLAGWPGNVHYAWSPDDQHLLVQSGNRAWIVTVP